MAISDERFTPAELLAMGDTEFGRHLCGGYGAGKLLKMVRSIKDMAKALDMATDTGQH